MTPRDREPTTMDDMELEALENPDEWATRPVYQPDRDERGILLGILIIFAAVTIVALLAVLIASGGSIYRGGDL